MVYLADSGATVVVLRQCLLHLKVRIVVVLPVSSKSSLQSRITVGRKELLYS